MKKSNESFFLLFWKEKYRDAPLMSLPMCIITSFIFNDIFVRFAVLDKTTKKNNINV